MAPDLTGIFALFSPFCKTEARFGLAITMKKNFPYAGIAVIIAVIVATIFIMGLLPHPPFGLW